MTNLLLVQALRTETEAIKISYMAQIAEWSTQEFENIVKLRNDFYDAESKISNFFEELREKEEE